MLTVYTRHSQKCPHLDDIAWRRCRCPKWIQGTPSEDHEFLRTVRVPLPTKLAELLRSLPTANPNYFFWSGNGDPETAKNGWQRALRRLFKRAKIKKPDGTPIHSNAFQSGVICNLPQGGATRPRSLWRVGTFCPSNGMLTGSVS